MNELSGREHRRAVNWQGKQFLQQKQRMLKHQLWRSKIGDPYPKPISKYDHWWRRSKYFSLFGGKSKPESKHRFVYERLIEPKEISAWAYEMARRLPKVGRVFDSQMAAEFDKLPAYPDLSDGQKGNLESVFRQHVNQPLFLLADPEEEIPGFSDSMGSMRFNLNASDAKLIKFFLKIIHRNRKSYQEMRKDNPDDYPMPPKHDPKRLVNWQMIGLLEHQRGKGLPLGRSQIKLRSDAKRLATKFLPLVQEALMK